MKTGIAQYKLHIRRSWYYLLAPDPEKLALSGLRTSLPSKLSWSSSESNEDKYKRPKSSSKALPEKFQQNNQQLTFEIATANIIIKVKEDDCLSFVSEPEWR